MTIKDKEGKDFDGGNKYRLTVLANAPVEQYWSATVYDHATQTPGLQKNADRSVDVYFEPKVPAGKESKWFPRAPMENSKSSSALCLGEAAAPEKRSGAALEGEGFRSPDLPGIPTIGLDMIAFSPRGCLPKG